MTEKRFTVNYRENTRLYEVKDKLHIIDCGGFAIEYNAKKCCDELNTLHEEKEQLKHKLEDWHQRTFKAHEYFNLLEKVIDEVCDDDISNQIWKEYEKREKLIE